MTEHSGEAGQCDHVRGQGLGWDDAGAARGEKFLEESPCLVGQIAERGEEAELPARPRPALRSPSRHASDSQVGLETRHESPARRAGLQGPAAAA